MIRLPQNEKQTYRMNSRPQMWPMGLTLIIILTFEIWRSNVTLTFDHTHDLDHGFSWSNSCISEWEGRFTLHKGCGSRSFMIMTVTIWWLRSGVWIYQIVTGVTSVVGVPSNHLVYTRCDIMGHDNDMPSEMRNGSCTHLFHCASLAILPESHNLTLEGHWYHQGNSLQWSLCHDDIKPSVNISVIFDALTHTVASRSILLFQMLAAGVISQAE